jgi:RHS repeat-associated protein
MRTAITLACVATLVPLTAIADETVDEIGALHTDVTFELPTFHGLEPALGLHYSSFGGPGPAGVGWELGGTSAIARADARRGAPAYDATDVFWLDGVELVPCAAVPASEACAAGATHTTRVESFTFVRYDTATNAWTVTDRDGVKSTYTAQVAWAGPLWLAGTYRWELARREDPHGNAVAFGYSCEALSWPQVGDCVLTSVTYGEGKACHPELDLPPGAPIDGAAVQLYWENRPDPVSLGIGEALLVSNRRLRTVTVSHGGVLLRGYTFTYGRGSTSGASILVGAEQFGDDALVTWAGHVVGGTRLPKTSYSAASLAPAPTAWGLASGSAGATSVSTTGPAFPTVVTQETMWRNYPFDRFLSADINGDGRSDIVKITADHVVQTGIARADGMYDLVEEVPVSVGGWTSPFVVPELPTHTYWYTGDVNGDGLQDIMNVMRHEPLCETGADAPCNCTINVAHIALRTAISKGDGHYSYAEQHVDRPFSFGFAFDWSFQWSVSVSAGPIPIGASGTITQGRSIWQDEVWMVGDANGDGRTDFLRAQRYARPLSGGGSSNSVRLEVYRSSGGSFVLPTGTNDWSVDTAWTWDNNSIAKERFMAGDIDGDGKTDFMVVGAHAQNIAGHYAQPHPSLRTARSNGNGTFVLDEEELSIDWGDNDLWFPGDFDGDGKADFFQIQQHNGHTAAGFAAHPHGAQLAFVSRGNGEFTSTGFKETPWAWHQPRPCIGNWTDAPYFPGDFDHDGRTDVGHVVVDHQYDCTKNYGNTITVGKILNTASGAVTTSTFATGVDWFTDKQMLLTAGDANGDGSDDVVFAQAPVEETRCDADGSCDFGFWYDLHTIVSPRSTSDTRSWQPTDVNGDGRQDLVYVHFANPGYRVQTLLRQSSGALTPLGQTIAPPMGELLDNAGAHRFAAADVAGPGGVPDGKADLVLVDHDETTIKIVTLIGNGDGTWTLAVDRPIVDTAGAPLPFAADLVNWRRVDVNGDGLLDLANTRFDTSGSVDAITLRSDGDGTWTTVNSDNLVPHGNSNTRQFRPADVDGDGRDDLVFIGSGLSTLFGQADGSFVGKAGNLTGFRDGPSWRVADVNGDGRHDFAHLAYATPASGLPTVTPTFIVSHGDGTFELATGTPWTFTGSVFYGETSAWQIADFDADGKSDFGVIDRHPFAVATSTVYTAMNQWPAFALEDYSVAATFKDTLGWRPMDLDSDGRSDLAYTGNGGVVSLTLPAASDRITGIDNGMGGVRTVTYRTSAGTHDRMPIGAVINVASILDSQDVLRGTAADQRWYMFDHARWSFADRRFDGFTNATSGGARGQTQTTFDLGVCGPRARTIDRLGNGLGTIERSRNTYKPTGAAPFLCLPEVQEHDDCEGKVACRTVTSRYTYDAFGNVVELTELGDTADKYDDRLISSPVNPNVTDWIVDRPAYRDVFQTDGMGGWVRMATERYLYDGQGSWKDPAIRGALTGIETWDDVGGSWVTTTMWYTPKGLVDKVSAPMTSTGAPTTRSITYDCTYERLPEQVCIGQLCTSATWDVRRAEVTKVTAVTGGETEYALDALGRIESTTTPDGAQLRMEHPTAAQWGTTAQVVRQLLDDTANGGTLDITTQLDGFGRTWRVTDSGTVVREYEYDGASTRVSGESLPHAPGQATPYWVYRSYDGADRLKAIHYPDGASEQFTYDVGTSSARNQVGAWRTTFHDAWGRPTAVREELGYCLDGKCSADYQWTHYRWDALGQLVEIVDDAGNVTTTTYDSMLRKRESCDPDRGCTTYTWREDGLLAEETDANDERRRVEYDGVGRPTRKEYVDAGGNVTRTVTYDYDVDPVTGAPRGGSNGELVRMDDTATGSDDFWYDLMGRPEREQRCIDGRCMSWAMAFDSVGRVASLTYPDGNGNVSPASEVVPYEYDGTGRLVRVPGYVEHIGYSDTGQVETLAYANNVKAVWTHDPRRMWMEHQTVDGPAGLLYSADYHYDAAGRITEQTLANPSPVTNTFTYDSLDRLLAVQSTDPHMERELKYDRIGNLVYHSRHGYLHYGDPLHVHAVTSTDSGNKYEYDRKGNLRYSHALKLEWNPDGMPTTVADHMGNVARYAYDPLGQMAKRDGPNGTTLIFGKLVEVDPNGKPIHYYYAGGARVAQRRDGKVTYYHADHLGSTRLVTDDHGAEVNRYDLGPFGETLGATTSVLNDFVFGPSRSDDMHGLVYMNARWMDPDIGRFISADSIVPDPFDPQSLNRYSYVRNNPISRIDPSGHEDYEANFTPGIDYSQNVCQTLPLETRMEVVQPQQPKTMRPVKAVPPSTPPPTVGAAEVTASTPPVVQPDPVAKPSTMSFDEWKASSAQHRDDAMSPEAREAAAANRFDDEITDGYIDPIVHKLAIGTRVLSFLGGPMFASIVNSGLDKGDANMRAAGRGDWDSAGGETGQILIFAATMTPYRAPVLAGMGGPKGVILKVPVSRAKVGAHAGAVEAKYATANDLINFGLVRPEVGKGVKYSNWQSKRYVRDLLFPGKSIKSTRIPVGQNVDEFISRQFGGPQAQWNQHLFDAKVNQYLGPMEYNAASALPDGTVIWGFEVQWMPRRRRKKWGTWGPPVRRRSVRRVTVLVVVRPRAARAGAR